MYDKMEIIQKSYKNISFILFSKRYYKPSLKVNHLKVTTRLFLQRHRDPVTVEVQAIILHHLVVNTFIIIIIIHRCEIISELDEYEFAFTKKFVATWGKKLVPVELLRSARLLVRTLQGLSGQIN